MAEFFEIAQNALRPSFAGGVICGVLIGLAIGYRWSVKAWQNVVARHIAAEYAYRDALESLHMYHETFQPLCRACQSAQINRRAANVRADIRDQYAKSEGTSEHSQPGDTG